MFNHIESPETFEKTYDYLYQKFDESDNWKIISSYDNQERYSDQGELPRYKVIQVCSPETAYKILDDDDIKYMGGMIPLKVCIYELNSGSVKVSFMNTGMMSKMFKDAEIADGIKAASDELARYMEDLKKI